MFFNFIIRHNLRENNKFQYRNFHISIGMEEELRIKIHFYLNYIFLLE